jgi:hypothetical protein
VAINAFLVLSLSGIFGEVAISIPCSLKTSCNNFHSARHISYLDLDSLLQQSLYHPFLRLTPFRLRSLSLTSRCFVVNHASYNANTWSSFPRGPIALLSALIILLYIISLSWNIPVKIAPSLIGQRTFEACEPLV